MTELGPSMQVGPEIPPRRVASQGTEFANVVALPVERTLSIERKELPPFMEIMAKFAKEVQHMTGNSQLTRKTVAAINFFTKAIAKPGYEKMAADPRTNPGEPRDSWLSRGQEAYFLSRFQEGCRTNFPTRTELKKIGLETVFSAGHLKQLEVAAMAIHSTFVHVANVEAGNFPSLQGTYDPETKESTYRELDQKQHRTMLGTTLLPDGNIGKILPRDKDVDHIIVLKKGRPFKINVFEEFPPPSQQEGPAHRRLRSPTDIMNDLIAIYNECEQTETELDSQQILSCSGAPDGRWSTVYSVLKNSPQNSQVFEDIEAAQLVVCLDEKEPRRKDQSKFSRLNEQFRSGGNVDPDTQNTNRNNRFHNKTQLIIDDEGKNVGFSWVHAITDGSVAAEAHEAIVKHIKHMPRIQRDSIRESSEPIAAELHLDIEPKDDDSSHTESYKQDLITALQEAQVSLHEMLDGTEIHSFSVEGIGKNIFKNAGFSPDTLMQILYSGALSALNDDLDPLSTLVPVNDRVGGNRVGFICPLTEATRSAINAMHVLRDLEKNKAYISSQDYEEKKSTFRAQIKFHLTYAIRDIQDKIKEVRSNKDPYSNMNAYVSAVFNEDNNVMNKNRGSTVEKFLSSVNPDIRKTVKPTVIISNGGMLYGSYFGTVPSREEPSDESGTIALAHCPGQDSMQIDLRLDGIYRGRGKEIEQYVREFAQLLKEVVEST